jgi:hypothetical protein
MTSHQLVYTSESTIRPFSIVPTLIFIFGDRKLLEESTIPAELHAMYPDAIFSGCSTAGEIAGETVADGTIVVTGVNLKNTSLVSAVVSLKDVGLKHIFVLSEGILVNGADLARGMCEELPVEIAVTGGMAADGSIFNKTVILEPDGKLASAKIAAIGFYGDSISIGYGSRGGWVSFGIERIATKSDGNILYEIDDQPALDLYKSFLGNHTEALPISALLFPFSMKKNKNSVPVARTILGINEENKSITFAGEVPQGAIIRLMRANNDHLIQGAADAATVCLKDSGVRPDFSILVSCIGRKVVLKQFIEEEVENVSDILGKPVITGFYSYGELAPFNENTYCELHNQTMTITTFREN